MSFNAIANSLRWASSENLSFRAALMPLVEVGLLRSSMMVSSTPAVACESKPIKSSLCPMRACLRWAAGSMHSLTRLAHCLLGRYHGFLARLMPMGSALALPAKRMRACFIGSVSCCILSHLLSHSSCAISRRLFDLLSNSF